MSQPPLSSEPEKQNNVVEGEIDGALRRYFRDDTAPCFRRHLRLKLQDPFSMTENGGSKLSSLWLGLGLIAALMCLTFVYFNFVRL